MGKNKYWLLVVDEDTRKSWSIFLKTKNELPAKMINFIDKLENEGVKLNKMKIQLENAGENLAFEKLAREKNYSKRLSLKFKFSAPHTLQQNGKVERKFPIFLPSKTGHSTHDFDRQKNSPDFP